MLIIFSVRINSIISEQQLDDGLVAHSLLLKIAVSNPICPWYPRRLPSLLQAHHEVIAVLVNILLIARAQKNLERP